ncbi:MAG: BamA/TamA family outer membrane protein [Bradymonadaceae bacterium]|nr:BamA/TamA family outer membrane protein [Lujinxingiaceae bacterium]
MSDFIARASLLGLVLLLVASTAPALAQSIDEPIDEAAEEPVEELFERELDPFSLVNVSAIVVEGLDRTQEFVVYQQLNFEAGAQVFVHEIDEGVRRLRNFSIFDRVDFTLEPALEGPDVDPDIARVLTFVLVERWTILPILNFNFGGNATSFSLGIYDLNIAGRNFELGGLYRYEAGAHSAGAWFRAPSFLGERIRFNLELWRASNLRLLYDIDGTLTAGFVHRSHYALMRLEQEWARSVKTTVGLRITFDDFGLDGVPEQARAGQQIIGLPPTTVLAIVVLGTEIGGLDQNSFLVSGQRAAFNLEVASSAFGADESFVSPRLHFDFFRTLPLQSTFGARLNLATSTTSSQPYQFFLGGLNSVRGYDNSRFHGATFWNANVELRVPSFNNRYFVLQHVFFADTARIGATPRDMLNITAASTGLGLRLIVPRIAGLTVRFDYAWTFLVPGEANFNMGSGQFF